MIAAAARLSLPRPRRGALGRMTGLSLLLHAALLALILIMAHKPPLTKQGAGPTSIEILPDVGAENGVTLSAPSFAPAIVQPKEAPASEPPPPPASAPAPTVPLASLPAPLPPLPVPPLPAPAPSATPQPPAAAAEPAPAVPPPPPVAEAAPLPPPPPAPPAAAPPPAPPPRVATRPPVQPARPAPPPSRQAMIPFPSAPLVFPSQRSSPLQRTTPGHGAIDLSLGPEALNSKGAPPRTSNGMAADIRVEGAQVGNDWIAQLHEWWNSHAYYPSQAIRDFEDGVVEIHMVILRDGRVESINIVSSSGSRSLDMAGASVFRDAHLMPFPLSTPEPRADVYLYLHYILVRG